MPQMKSARGNSWVQNLSGMQERHLIFLNSLRKPLLADFLCAKKRVLIRLNQFLGWIKVKDAPSESKAWGLK